MRGGGGATGQLPVALRDRVPPVSSLTCLSFQSDRQDPRERDKGLDQLKAVDSPLHPSDDDVSPSTLSHGRPKALNESSLMPVCEFFGPRIADHS